MTSGEISITEIIRCTNFAAIKHKNQRRKDPESTPYINHPREKNQNYQNMRFANIYR
jgi:hypothetical protein